MENMHFYNKTTRVSLELPIGWEEFREGKNSVTYLYELDEDEEDKSADPKIIIALFPAGKPDLSILETSSTSLLVAQKNILEKISHAKREVDEYPALEDIFSYTDPELGGDIYQHNVFVLIDDVLYNFSMLCPLHMKDEYAPSFEGAIRSIRFIF